MKKHILRFGNIAALVTCFGLMCLVAVRRDGKLFGEKIYEDNKEVAAVANSGATPQSSGVTYHEQAATPDVIEVAVSEHQTDISEATTTNVSKANTTKQVTEVKRTKTVRKTVAITDTIIRSADSGVEGYNGPVPVEIEIKDGVVASVKALDNEETPGFFKRVVEGGLFECWNGKSAAEGATMQVDGISGATYTSNAVIANVREGLKIVAAGKEIVIEEPIEEAPSVNEGKAEEKSASPATTATETGKDVSSKIVTDTEEKHEIETPTTTSTATIYKDTPTTVEEESGFKPTWQWIVSLAAVLCGLLLPLFIKKRIYRNIQLAINVAALGFLTGSFLSYSLMVRFISQGIDDWCLSLTALLMLFAAFIMPLLGKKRHYCMWICPLGSAQELMGKIVKRKPKLGKKTIKVLTRVRETIWYILMIAMWFGVWYEWMDYEPFACFMLQDAQIAVIASGCVILALSVIIDRPYCRFVCPTGTLFKQSEKQD